MPVRLRFVPLPKNCLDCRIRQSMGCYFADLNKLDKRPDHCLIDGNYEGTFTRKRMRYICSNCGSRYFKVKKYCPACGSRIIIKK